jgi:PPE-repeat protein
MDFAMLTPETISGRLYAGSGSGSLVAAAEAWDKLAAELYSAANSYKSVISGLTSGPWQGPSSASMAAAAASNVTWLSSTAAQAEEAASQARAAVAAYEEAYASVVPPPLIAANRTQLSSLLATNILGQNTSAIATLEAQYAEMWAADVAAMYSYASSSAAATTLTPFIPPQQSTNSASQAGAAEQAASIPAGNAQNAVSAVQQSFSAVPNALQSLATAAPAAAAPAQAADPLGTLSDLISIFLDAPSALATFFADIPFGVIGVTALPLDIIGAGTGVHTDDIVSGWNGQQSWPGNGPAPVKPFPAPLLNLPAGTIPAGTTAPALSAGLGEASTVGALSVPPTWTISTPAVRPVAYTLPALPPETAAPTAAAGLAAEGSSLGSSSTLGEMALAGMAGRAMAGTVAGGGKGGGKALKRERPRADTAAEAKTAASVTDNDSKTLPDKPRTVVTGVAAELREFANLRDEGILTDEEYIEQKNRLLGR